MSLTNAYFSSVQRKGKHVAVYLKSGIKFFGYLVGFDEESLFLTLRDLSLADAVPYEVLESDSELIRDLSNLKFDPLKVQLIDRNSISSFSIEPLSSNKGSTNHGKSNSKKDTGKKSG